ncbi:MAG: PKD domain-containing protein, partial [Bacteroidia bacterium]
VCAGTATSFLDASSVNGSSINSWNWDFDSNGSIDNTSQNPNYTFATAGNYTVTLNVSSAQGCSSSYSAAVTVLSNPTASFLSANACQNAASQFTNTSSVPSPAGITAYQWSFGNGGSSAMQNPSYAYSSAGTFNVSLTVVSSQGCTGSTSSNIVIYPLPVVNFSSTSVCFNQPTVLTNQTSINNGSISNWEWDFDNNGSVDATVANPNFVYPSAGSFICKLKATSANGCSASATMPVTVYANPVAAFSSQSVCLNKAMNFADHSTTSMGNITVWNWDFDSDGIVDNVSQNPSHTYTTTGTFLVTLEVQTSNGCVTTIQKAVRVNPNPVVNFIAPVQQGCPSLCINFTNSSTIATGNISHWSWNFGDNTLPSTLQSPQHCFGTGQYHPVLTAISDSGCVGSYTASTAINVFPTPDAGFAITTDNSESPDIIDPSVNIVDQSNGASTYQYFISDGAYSTNGTFSHTFNSETEGTYMVTQVVTNIHGCKDSITKPVEIKPAYTFYIPNAFSPNNDNKNEIFKGEGIGIQEYNMWIFDRWGNMIFYTNELERGWDGRFQGGSEKTVMQDVFVWKVQLKDIFNKKHDLKGTVAVVR